MSTDLSSLPFDPELTPGARNAVEVCLRIQPDEKVTVITDRACREIAASLVRNWTLSAPRSHAFVLEEIAPRPCRTCRRRCSTTWNRARSAFSPCKRRRNELRTRMQMTDVVNRRKIRHAHMVNIEKRIMLEGMRADFLKVDRVQRESLGDRHRRQAHPRHGRPPAPTSPPTSKRTTNGSRPAALSALISGAICRAAKSLPLPAK